MPFANRITELLGVEIPIVQAPMGWIARAQLASAVAGRIDAVRPVAEIVRECAAECLGVLERLAAAYPRATGTS